MLEGLQDAYSFLDRLNVSMTGLIAAALVFSLALFFALREAATWYFKIDDLKRDIKRLQGATTQIEAELRTIQNLILKSHDQRSEAVEPNATERTAETATLKKTAQAKPGGFPIVH